MSLRFAVLTTWIGSFRRLRGLRRLGGASVLALALGFAIGAVAQTVDTRHWQGHAAMSRQSEHVVATSNAEWRSLWSRVGVPAPDMFEPGRTHAVGIFLGTRPGEGYGVNVISTSRRRDRLVVVFEERSPQDDTVADRRTAAPTARVVSGPAGGAAGGGTTTFAPATAASGSAPALRPVGKPTSPWAIVLINRTDLPISVEQRLFR